MNLQNIINEALDDGLRSFLKYYYFKIYRQYGTEKQATVNEIVNNAALNSNNKELYIKHQALGRGGWMFGAQVVALDLLDRELGWIQKVNIPWKHTYLEGYKFLKDPKDNDPEDFADLL